MFQDDVIAAVATPIGEGGLAVVRVSGKNAIQVVDQGFRGKRRLASARTHTAHFGHFTNQTGEIIDEIVATVYKEPNSYTGENSCEISCHGGVFVIKNILSSLIEFGARLAEPGEFTKRAFLNGRIDLIQAEAVADLIHSQSELSHRVSIQQLQGRLSEVIRKLRESLLHYYSLIELEIDFMEEGIELTKKLDLISKLDEIILTISEIIESYKTGKIYQEGVKVVLSGRPNAGKSSVFNALLNEDRAIVTEIPGTTRDTISEKIVIKGVIFNITDTAGLRAPQDVVESEGVSRSLRQIELSDLLLWVVDYSNGNLNHDLEQFNSFISNNDRLREKIILCLNKIDLLQGIRRTDHHLFEMLPNILISAKYGSGIDNLKDLMHGISLREGHQTSEKTIFIANKRHFDCFVKSVQAMNSVRMGIIEGKSNEFLSFDLRIALNSLGEIIGEVTTEDLLDTIFSKFCIGK